MTKWTRACFQLVASNAVCQLSQQRHKCSYDWVCQTKGKVLLPNPGPNAFLPNPVLNPKLFTPPGIHANQGQQQTDCSQLGSAGFNRRQNTSQSAHGKDLHTQPSMHSPETQQRVAGSPQSVQ